MHQTQGKWNRQNMAQQSYITNTHFQGVNICTSYYTLYYETTVMKIDTRTYSLSIQQYPDGYLAYFPALEGCNTWGKTYEEAVKHAEEALALYLETLDDLGKSVPEELGQKQPVSL